MIKFLRRRRRNLFFNTTQQTYKLFNCDGHKTAGQRLATPGAMGTDAWRCAMKKVLSALRAVKN